MSQAGPSNDINAGSPGSQKAPTQIPASLVRWLARYFMSDRIKTLESDPCQDPARARARPATAAAEDVCAAASKGAADETHLRSADDIPSAGRRGGLYDRSTVLWHQR